MMALCQQFAIFKALNSLSHLLNNVAKHLVIYHSVIKFSVIPL